MSVRNSLRITSGFTLLELLLVMVILTVMVAIVVPSMSAFAIGRKTNYAAIQIVAMAKYARAEAVNEGRIYRLTFDSSKPAKVTLMADNSGEFVESGSSLGKQLKLDDGLTLRTDLTPQSPGGTYIDFHPDGRTGDGPVHVWVSDKQGRVIEMACLSPTELLRVLPKDEMTNQ